jgi:hypothetical protein
MDKCDKLTYDEMKLIGEFWGYLWIDKDGVLSRATLKQVLVACRSGRHEAWDRELKLQRLESKLRRNLGEKT